MPKAKTKTSSKKTRSAASRKSGSSSRKSKSSLKSHKIFSPIQLIVVMLVVAVAVVAVAIRQHSDISNAIAVGGPLGRPGPGLVGSISATSRNPITANVSGSSITLTGKNLMPGDRVTVGQSSAKTSFVSLNADGTTTVAAPVNTGSCAVQSIPILKNLCNNATAGVNTIKITSATGSGTAIGKIGLVKSNSAPSAAATALGSALGGGSGAGGGSRGSGTCPAGQGPTATGGCASCGADNCAKGCSAAGYGTQFIKPVSGDVWNYGSPFTITWKNCSNGLVKLRPEMGPLMPEQFFVSFGLFDTAGENAGPGGAVPVPGGGYKAGTGGYLHACAILSSDSKFAAGLGVIEVPGLNDPGATNTITLSKCKTDIGTRAASMQHIPTGQYKVDFAVDVASGPKGCTPGYRCSGLPDRIGPPNNGSQGTFRSDQFQLNNN